MSRADLVDEVANELDSWPGVRVERGPDGAALVLYQHVELGHLDRERGLVEVRFPPLEREELIEHGDAEPAESEAVSHDLDGPADVTAALELFDRRYRDVRGEDYPYSSQDPA